jgi:hypothetical protein
MTIEAPGHFTIAQLRAMRFAQNPKKHDVPGIAASIVRFGFTIPIGVDMATSTVVSGHERIETIELMRSKGPIEGRPWPPRRVIERDDGEWLLPIVALNFDSVDERDAYVIADNRLTEAGGWDDDKLRQLLARFDAPS